MPIQNGAASAGLPLDAASSSRAAKLIESVSELAVLPHVVFKVLELSGSTDNSSEELEKAITVDPAFTTRLLTHANSSYYGLARKLTSIREALVYLGFKEVRQIAMTIGVFDMFVGKNDKNSLRRRAWWRLSLDTAIACRFLAETSKRLDPGEAYTCGLLHCTGKTLLDRFGGADYALVEQRLTLGASETDSERRVFGCDNEAVAILAGKKWGLSPQTVESFRITGEPVAGDAFPEYRACVAIGNMIARLAVVGTADIDMLPSWAIEHLGLPQDSLKDLFDHAVNHIAAANAMSF